MIGHADGGSDAAGRIEFNNMPLTVGEGERVQLVALAPAMAAQWMSPGRRSTERLPFLIHSS